MDWFLFAFFGISGTIILLLLINWYVTAKHIKLWDKYLPIIENIAEMKLLSEVIIKEDE